MVAPLVGIAIGAAAKMAAKKLAQQGAKKAAKTAATRARSNSAAAAKATKPTKSTERKLDMKKPCKTCGMIHANPAFKHDARVEGFKSSIGRALGGNTGKAVTERVKIKSGGDIKPAVPKKAKPMSYSQLKDMPNLVKIDSAKGNTVKKIAYRKRTSK